MSVFQGQLQGRLCPWMSLQGLELCTTSYRLWTSQMVQGAEQWYQMLFGSHCSPNPHALPLNNSFMPNVLFFFFFLFPTFISVRLKRENRTVLSLLPQHILPLEIKEITERGEQRNKKQKVKKTVEENQHSSKLKKWLFKALHESRFNEGPIPSEAHGIITLKLHRISFTSSKLRSDEPWPSLNKWM